MITALLEAVDEGLEIQAFCSPKNIPGPSSANTSSLHAGRRSVCTLSIFVYGTFSWFDDIGKFFQSHELYLQDPLDCDRSNLRYCNPHRLSWKDLDSSVCISDLAKCCVGGETTTLEQQRDVLEVFDVNDHLVEAAQPRGIKTPLARHQKESLTFMVRRESKCVFDGSDAEIWEAIQGREGKAYLNRVSQEVQDQEPPQFQGGIIADPMGLGKTLSMISLIAMDTERALRASQRHGLSLKYKMTPSLVVVPPSILHTWEEQFAEHAVPGEIRFRRHYGNNRLQSAGCLENCEAVLTSYHTVSSEWRKASRTNDASSILFGTRWRRVILDEAHYIRNGKSNMAKSVCSLEADARWAVTGTPVQNSLSDLTSLLTFLRAYPYADTKKFDVDIAKRWKTGTAEGAEEAVKRLKCLARCLLLRRPKSTLQLPDRHDLLKPLELSPEERAYYDRTKQQAELEIQDALLTGDETTGACARALQQIEALRMICNLGLHYRRPKERKTAVQGLNEEAVAWANIAQENFNFQREFGLGDIRCEQCKTSVDEMDDGIEAEPASAVTTSCFFSRCLRFTCSECAARVPRLRISCGHEPHCPITAIQIGGLASETIISPEQSDTASPSSLPTKVQALVADIKGLDPAIKSVVFSSWRKTLDLTRIGLEQHGIQCVRFDGTVPQESRQGVVEQFRKDPKIRVMLLTLSCGAVGLNLTVASRAYLMEPHWNPTQEEQALARIHRMGQTQPVTTIRLHIKNSYEQNILDLQKDKTHLAGVILSQKNEKAGGEAGIRSLLVTTFEDDLGETYMQSNGFIQSVAAAANDMAGLDLELVDTPRCSFDVLTSALHVVQCTGLSWSVNEEKN
ncbi:SNF2 family N-terminal domain-containing protein [Podospora appendiculata]|uniref:SNF2 family N-terminal domain-containing protein n=1 Tax=Podospora appendiculata TaxID=314037 RepID=A0AAE0X823_9PEZI|nr:SNF2 family N-terminal domain-containing protein [Podospora appendiculata]